MIIESGEYGAFCRIHRTSFSVKRDCGLCSPTLPRPLDSLSAMLSTLVPRKRWAGLTQARLSHLWSMHMLSSMLPCVSAHDTRDALKTLLLFPMAPYPCASSPAVHVQHRPSSTRTTGPFLSTLSQNLSANGRRLWCPWMKRIGSPLNAFWRRLVSSAILVRPPHPHWHNPFVGSMIRIIHG